MLLQSSTKILDLKYIGLLSNRLQLFKRKKNNLFNFRCPFCGDSSSKKFKARGYIYERGGNFFYMCHNCGVSTTAKSFIKSIDPVLYKEYMLESMKPVKAIKEIRPEQFKTVTTFKRSVFKELKKISQLKIDHPARVYIVDRKIPVKYHSMLYYCPKFMRWSNSLKEGKFSVAALKNDEPRLIIPMIDKDGDVIGYQGRSFKVDSRIRYITIILDEDKPKIFGLNNIIEDEDIFVLEGPIDSMFVDNSIAMCGSDAAGLHEILPKENLVFVYDNEPRNKHIVSRIQKAIDNGYKVVIWPDSLKEKDVNDIRMTGLKCDQIKDIIEMNIYYGLAATARLQQWTKV